jgi:hypothetical protein
LLCRPLRSRMGRHIEVQNTAPIMRQHQEHVKNLKRELGTVKKSMDTSSFTGSWKAPGSGGGVVRHQRNCQRWFPT